MNSLAIALTLLDIAVVALLAATPWLMPKTELFTVVIPPEHLADPRLAGLKRRYAAIVSIVGAACLIPLASLLGTSLGAHAQQQLVARVTLGITAGMCVPILAAFVVMLAYRRKLLAIKRSENWQTQSGRAAAAVGPEDIPKPPSMRIYLVYIPLVIALAIIPIAFYDAFPSQIPMHTDFAGTVNSWVDKSMPALLFPALFTCFMGCVFAFVHWVVMRSKRPLDPSVPTATAYAYGAFARAQSIGLYLGGLVLSITMGVTFLLSSAGAIELGAAGIAVVFASVAFVAIIVAISVIYGQSGARIVRDMGAASPVSTEDDRHWVMGTFYVNRGDASVFVPKRFGIGWTLNLGRPAAWIGLVVFVAVIVGFTLLICATVS